MKASIIIRICIFIILAAAVSIGAYFGLKKFKSVQIEKKHLAVTSQLEKVCELSVLKSNYSDVICIKKTAAAGLAKAYSIVKYSGVIRAGIKDVSLIKLSFSDDGKSVKAVIPHCQILGNGLIKQEVFDEKQSIFIPISVNEIFQEIQTGMKETQANLTQSGFLNEADQQAKLVVSSFLSAFGYDSITVEF